MADKSLYDLLEVSPKASPEAIRGAYERLSQKHNPFGQDGSFDSDIKIQQDAIKEAFFILGSPAKRAKYDQDRLAKLNSPLPSPQPSKTWSPSSLLFVLLALCASGWFYYQHQQTEKQIALERSMTEAKAREAAETERIEAERVRIEAEKSRLQGQPYRAIQSAEERARREHEMSLRNYAIEQRNSSQTNEYQSRRNANEQRRADEIRRREEQQAESAARAQAAREKAELCRIERERYGTSVSC